MPAAESPATPGSDVPTADAPTDDSADRQASGDPEVTRTRRPKRQPTAGDMIRSLAVLLIPVLVITVLFTRDPEEQPGTEPVDWGPVHSQAKDEAEFEVLAPTNLPPEWTPVRVEWDAGERGDDQRWMVGWLSPQRTYFAVEQSNAETQAFLERVTREGVKDGTSSVAGATWLRYHSPDDRTRALVRVGDRVTTVVVADSSYEALEAFAGTLG